MIKARPSMRFWENVIVVCEAKEGVHQCAVANLNPEVMLCDAVDLFQAFNYGHGMAIHISDGRALRFQIDPQPGESLRGCTAIAQRVMPPSRGNAIILSLFALAGFAAYFVTPTRLSTFLIAQGAILATTYALQAEGRRRLRRLQTADPHALETHFVEIGPEGLHAWCAHVDARYSWNDFVRVAEDNEFYLFTQANGSGSAIPKRLLDDATDAALRDRIREWSPDHGSGLARASGN